MNAQRERDGAPWWSVLAVFLTCIFLVVATFYLQSQQRRASERKFCKVVAASKKTEKGKLDRYITDPPTTDAGRAQRDELAISYRNYVDLEWSLGCPLIPEKEK